MPLGDLPLVERSEKIVPIEFHVALGHNNGRFNDKPSITTFTRSLENEDRLT